MKLDEVMEPQHRKYGFSDEEAENPEYQDPAYLVEALKKQVDNTRVDDAQFRNFVRKSLPMYTKYLDVQHVDIKAPQPRAAA